MSAEPNRGKVRGCRPGYGESISDREQLFESPAELSLALFTYVKTTCLRDRQEWASGVHRDRLRSSYVERWAPPSSVGAAYLVK